MDKIDILVTPTYGFNPFKVVILKPTFVKNLSHTKEERKISKLSKYLDTLDTIYFYCIISTIVTLAGALIGISLNISLVSLTDINWFALLIAIIIPIGIYLVSLLVKLLYLKLWHKKLNLLRKI